MSKSRATVQGLFDNITGTLVSLFADGIPGAVQQFIGTLSTAAAIAGATTALASDTSGNYYDASGNVFKLTSMCLSTWKQLPRALQFMHYLQPFTTQPDPSIGLGVPPWQASTQYPAGAVRANGPYVYRNKTLGVSAASGGPSGTGLGIGDGGCTWDYMYTNQQAWGLSVTGTVTFTNGSANIGWTAHGLIVSQKVGFNVSAGGTLPGGTVTEKAYFVSKVVDANTIQVSDRLNGAPITVSSAGSGTFTGIRNPLFNEVRVVAANVQYRVQTGRGACWPSFNAGGPTGTTTAYDGSTSYSVTSTVGTPGTFTKTAHGLTENTPVAMSGSTPGGTAGGTIYYVHVVDANTISLMATPNGLQIAFTTVTSPTLWINAIVYSALANYYIDTVNGNAANSASAYNAAKVAFPAVSQNTNYWVAAGSVFNVDWGATANFFSISQPGVSISVYDPVTGNEITTQSNPFDRASQGDFVKAEELATKYFSIVGNANTGTNTADTFTGTTGSAFSGNSGGTQSSYTLIRGAYVTGCAYAAFRATGNSKWRVEDCAIAHCWKLQTATNNNYLGDGFHYEGWGAGHQVVRCYMWDIGEDVFWQSSGFGSIQDWAITDCAMQHNPRSTYNGNHMDGIQTGQYPGNAIIQRCVIECNLPPGPLINLGGGTNPIGAGVILDNTGQWVANTVAQVDARQVNNGNTYICRKSGTTASSGGPSGTGTGIVDNGATWDFLNSLPCNLQVKDCIIMSNVLCLDMTNAPGGGQFTNCLFYCNHIDVTNNPMGAQIFAMNVQSWPLVGGAAVFENILHPQDAIYAGVTLAINESNNFVKVFGT